MALHKEVKNGNGLSPEPTHALCCIGKQFTLVSREGEEITIPVYYLLAWSDFFRDLLQMGQGTLRVDLPERAETISQFKSLIYTRSVEWQKSGGKPFFTQVFDLVAFLDKYECPRALNDLIDILTIGVRGDLPPLVLFCVGARLDRPEVCKVALNSPKGRWDYYRVWTHPPGIAGVAKTFSTLHPNGIPYELLTKLPFDYVLALSLAPVHRAICNAELDVGLNGEEFERQLGMIRQSAQVGKETKEDW